MIDESVELRKLVRAYEDCQQSLVNNAQAARRRARWMQWFVWFVAAELFAGLIWVVTQ